MNDTELVYAMVLDGKGGGRELSEEQVLNWKPEQGLLWVHLGLTDDETKPSWLERLGGIDGVTAGALRSEVPRPRAHSQGSNLLTVLRGVNFNPGSEPEDMVALRGRFEENRIITLRRPKVMAIQDLRACLLVGRGPTDVGDFLVDLINRLLDRMIGLVGELGESVDNLEDRVLEERSHDLRPVLAKVRRQAISLRRFMAPQRDVLSRLPNESVPWLDDLHRARLREEAERIARYVEEIDADRDRAAVTQEELSSHLAERLNHTMFVLSVVTVVFLPLGLITGLLGINVGGMPGVDNPWAFSIVSIGLTVMAVALLIVFRRLRML
ncbi:MAG: zinc transporter ZntB [Acidobacteriota bacterium]